MANWLVKSEPTAYSIDDLKREKKTDWTGVRNYAARLHLRAMQKGDDVLFYQSSTNPGVVGLAKVTRTAFPDSTAADGDWSAVELTFTKKFHQGVSLAQLKSTKALQNMIMLKQSRLSVSPITELEYNTILELAG